MKMKKRIFVLAGIVALLDQLVKIVITNFLPSEGITVIKDFFYLSYVKNEGAAFGMFSGSRWALIIISICAIYAIIKYFILDVKVTKVEFISYALILGGIVGNLIDRILYGYVIDYFDFRIMTYHFPVFNIADTAMVIGTILVILHLINNAVKQRRKA